MKADQKNNKQEEGFAGTLKNIQLNDLIQMCCLSAVSLGIRVKKDNKQGVIIIKDGQIVHAKVGETEGEEAFFKILGWESGIFETVDSNFINNVTIKNSYQFLLMEAAHQADLRESKKGEGEKKNEPVLDKLKVLVVDDSPMMSKILSSMINADGRLEVAATAENGERALAMLDELKPDLVTMDVNMPVMDGSTALKHIMIKSPCPVLIMSNMGDGSHKEIIDFLNLGAVDFMRKPVQNKHILIQQQKIVERVLQAAGAKIYNFKRVRTQKVTNKPGISATANGPCQSVLIISAGAGGHSDLLDLLSRLSAQLSQCVLIFQTIPPALVKTVADFLDERSRLNIKPLSDGMALRKSQCLFTTHGRELTLQVKDGNAVIEMGDEDIFENESGNFDNLLTSISTVYSDKIQVVLLSGSEIGSIEGLRNVKQNGGRIVIQKRSTCMVAAPLQKVAEHKLYDAELDMEEIIKDIGSFT